jgi:pimeloyl-ACP methyl ester carboxylesterase
MIATAEHQGHLKGGIAGAELISLPSHGHNLHWENPDGEIEECQIPFRAGHL